MFEVRIENSCAGLQLRGFLIIGTGTNLLNTKQRESLKNINQPTQIFIYSCQLVITIAMSHGHIATTIFNSQLTDLRRHSPTCKIMQQLQVHLTLRWLLQPTLILAWKALILGSPHAIAVVVEASRQRRVQLKSNRSVTKALLSPWWTLWSNRAYKSCRIRKFNNSKDSDITSKRFLLQNH